MSAHDAWHPQELPDTYEAIAVERGLKPEPAPVIPIRRGHCIYCGAWTTGYACRGHRDLINIDPVMLARRGRL